MTTHDFTRHYCQQNYRYERPGNTSYDHSDDNNDYNDPFHTSHYATTLLTPCKASHDLPPPCTTPIDLHSF
ncbi:hypothetical protein E2C01_022594 [Portunus trituberculatus]|uniref:Uncharacterized protein n=1 Tax=Portunus trituberculatus TaxID=210409 RepID=A0A5B7E7Q0_PORTR|nr:hypothetical protein [Portunus trituberculatus]